jgi:hypothetical protein
MAYIKNTTADIQKELEEMGDPVTDIIKKGDFNPNLITQIALL